MRAPEPDEQERADAERAAGDHAQALAAEHRERRRPLGAFYTPDDVVAWVLDRALAPAPGAGGGAVLDPACGTGHFLVAAARRLGVRAVHGSDIDAEAVAIARRRLAALDPSAPAALLEQQVVVADGLEHWQGRRFAAVVGNPPFLGQLRRDTAGRDGAMRRGLGAYTDTSAVFLDRALDLVGDGGVVALVQPLSVLAARDAGPVRRRVGEVGAVVDLWVATRPVFDDTDVLTCVPVVRVGATPPTDPDAWGRLAAPSFAIPTVELDAGTGAVADVADCVADFRDQYYGLVPHVREADHPDRLPPGTAPLVTTGLVDPAECRWGAVDARFARRRWAAPVVDLAALEADDAPRLRGWAASRLVPKLLVAGQGRVLEAVVDAAGAWLPSVPLVSVVPRDGGPADPDVLWRLLALTLAPPVVADAAARHLGTGMSAGAIKLSARQVAALPLPADRALWAEGALLARRAQVASSVDRGGLLDEAATVMNRAYGGDDRVLAWWRARRLGSASATS